MKAIDSTINWFKSIPVMTWMWVGCGFIVLSNVLQLVAPSYPTFPLATLGIVINTISVPLTIFQAYRSALDFKQEQKRTDAVALNDAIRSSELILLGNLNKAPDSMPHKDTQVIQRRNDATE